MSIHLKAFADATNNELFDPDYRGGEWMCEHAETAETLDEFIASSKMWRECSSVRHGEIAGFAYIYFRNVQLRGGQSRQSLSVVDFGDRRVALPGTDISYYVACAA